MQAFIKYSLRLNKHSCAIHVVKNEFCISGFLLLLCSLSTYYICAFCHFCRRNILVSFLPSFVFNTAAMIWENKVIIHFDLRSCSDILTRPNFLFLKCADGFCHRINSSPNFGIRWTEFSDRISSPLITMSGERRTLAIDFRPRRFYRNPDFEAFILNPNKVAAGDKWSTILKVIKISIHQGRVAGKKTWFFFFFLYPA